MEERPNRGSLFQLIRVARAGGELGWSRARGKGKCSSGDMTVDQIELLIFHLLFMLVFYSFFPPLNLPWCHSACSAQLLLAGVVF